MKSGSAPQTSNAIDLRPLKEKLKKKLPPDSPVLVDLLAEPDLMQVENAEVLISHYLRRLERELQRYGTTRPFFLRP